jgi:hypothetical protein
MIKRVLRYLSGTSMVIVPMLGLMAEAPEGSPLTHQLMIWAGSVVLTMACYVVYRLAGGTFRFRDIFETE